LNQHVQHYNQELAKLSEQEGVTLVKINEAFMLKEYQTLFCEDGLHPNSRGHKLIFEEVSKALPKF
jgi:lysophospholipase L1-like esterase